MVQQHLDEINKRLKMEMLKFECTSFVRNIRKNRLILASMYNNAMAMRNLFNLPCSVCLYAHVTSISHRVLFYHQWFLQLNGNKFMDLVFLHQNSMKKMIDFEWNKYHQNEQLIHDWTVFAMYLIVLKFEYYIQSYYKDIRLITM